MSFRAAELEVLAAAECACRSYRAYGGYTIPLAVNMRRLDDAVRVWEGLIRAASLDSDTNGFDRSMVWGKEHSNEQSQRRLGCAAAKNREEGDRARSGAA